MAETETEKLQRKLAEEKATTAGLLAKLKEAESATARAEEERDNLKEFVAQADEKAEITYVLEPIRRSADGTPDPCSRYDGMVDDDKFIWHEAINFANDTGYDESVILGRVQGSIARAVGQDQEGRMGPNCDRLPPFNPANELEVIVRLKTA